MKKNIVIICVALFTLTNQLLAQTAAVYDSASVSPGYTNQTWYSLANGTVKTTDNTNWDLGFQISGYESSIIINSKNNVKLYLASTDTTQWATADTTGALIPTNQLNNADSNWLYGAFNRNSTVGVGGFDLGWGTYDFNTHIVSANNIYFIKLSTGAVLKLMIESLANSIYTFKYANIDGTNLQAAQLVKTQFTGKNFGYYSIANNAAIDREPLSSNWDILFHQYLQEIPFVYKVVGAQINLGCKAYKAYPIDTHTVALDTNLLVTNTSEIGAFWKSFDFNTNTWTIEDSMVYFVQAKSGDIYKLVFTGFGGSSTGNIYFTKQLMSAAAGVNNIKNQNIFISTYPNPAQQSTTVLFKASGKNTKVSVVNMLGKIVYNTEIVGGTNELQTLRLNTNNWSNGLYKIIIENNQNTTNTSLIISN